MKISEIMTAEVRCVRPDNTLEEAAGLMRKLDVGAVPVCGDDEKLVGMLTDRDIVVRAVADGRPASTVVQEVLSPGVIYAFENQDVDDAVLAQERERAVDGCEAGVRVALAQAAPELLRRRVVALARQLLQHLEPARRRPDALALEQRRQLLRASAHAH